MLRWIVLAVLVVALTATATIVVQSLPADESIGARKFPVAKLTGPRPKVVVDDPLIFKFGAKPQHTKFEKDWVIKNEGNAELKLELEAPPCSCTVAGFQDSRGAPTAAKSVPPRSQITMHLTWETRDNQGKYYKPASIITNDPENPKIEFAAEGEVYPAVTIFPFPRVELNEVSTDAENPQASIFVYSNDRPELKITRLVTSKPKNLVAEQEPMNAEQCKELKVKAGIKVTVKVKPGLPLAQFSEELLIGTDHPNQPELKVPVTGKMVGPIAVVPERIRIFGISNVAGGTKEVVLLVRGHRVTKFEVKYHPEKFKVAIEPGDNSSKPGKYRMIVTVPPGTPPGTVDDQIILNTDHPQARELRIPIYGFISDSAAE